MKFLPFPPSLLVDLQSGDGNGRTRMDGKGGGVASRCRTETNDAYYGHSLPHAKPPLAAKKQADIE
jgi:hypothetical protein